MGEGCHLYGKLLVNKVAGNFHIAPGKSFQQVHVPQMRAGSPCADPYQFMYTLHSVVLLSQGNMHVHDLVPFPTKDFDFSHTIHKLTFGEGYPGMKNPLDGVTISQQGPRNPTGRPGMFQYFLRVKLRPRSPCAACWASYNCCSAVSPAATPCRLLYVCATHIRHIAMCMASED